MTANQRAEKVVKDLEALGAVFVLEDVCAKDHSVAISVRGPKKLQAAIDRQMEGLGDEITEFVFLRECLRQFQMSEGCAVQ